MTEDEIVGLLRSPGKPREQGLRALYTAVAPGMLRFFVHMGVSPDDARDILQETIVKIYRAADAYRPTGSAKAWFWKIARNALTDYMRRKSAISQHEQVFDSEQWSSLEETTLAVTVNSVATTIEECVRAGLARFASSRPERAYVLTLQMEGSSIESIAGQIGRSANATKEYLSQCKKKLQPFLANCAELLAVEQT